MVPYENIQIKIGKKVLTFKELTPQQRYQLIDTLNNNLRKHGLSEEKEKVLNLLVLYVKYLKEDSEKKAISKDVSPEEIARLCKEIQKSWTEKEKKSKRVIQPIPYQVPKIDRLESYYD